jgi:hypothetical protein
MSLIRTQITGNVLLGDGVAETNTISSGHSIKCPWLPVNAAFAQPPYHNQWIIFFAISAQDYCTKTERFTRNHQPQPQTRMSRSTATRIMIIVVRSIPYVLSNFSYVLLNLHRKTCCC